jgi:hypothetical protein
MNVRLSPSGIELLQRFGPHMKTYRRFYDCAAKAGRTLDWSRLRGQVVGEVRRYFLVAVAWNIDVDVQLLHKSFVDAVAE